MSESPSSEEQLAKAAQISGNDGDPLAEFAEQFEGSDIDFFQLFIDQSLSIQGLSESTLATYHRAFRFWKAFMEKQDRHPAFPSDTHVKSYIEYERNERGNSQATVKNKLRKIEAAYDYWVEESRLPHPKDYRPIQLARMKVNLDEPLTKETWPLSVRDLREAISSITDLRSRIIVVLQLKLGLRATEVANIQIQDVSIENPELRSHFSEMGTSRRVKEYENTLYVPSRHEREGNKSERPRLLPLDSEVRYLLLQYLLVRPSVDEPWLFLTKGSYKQLWRNEVNDAWSALQEKYGETEDYRKITSHYGRHFFSTYWRVDQDLQRELVQYMRGDRIGGTSMKDRAVIDEYLHTNYEDIEDEYRQRVYNFNF